MLLPAPQLLVQAKTVYDLASTVYDKVKESRPAQRVEEELVKRRDQIADLERELDLENTLRARGKDLADQAAYYRDEFTGENARKSKRRRIGLWTGLGITAAVVGIAGGAYYVLTRSEHDEPAAQPPRLSDIEPEEVEPVNDSEDTVPVVPPKVDPEDIAEFTATEPADGAEGAEATDERA